MKTISKLAEVLQNVLEVHDVIAISGAPGIGKSQIVHQLLKADVLEVRLYEQGSTAAGIPWNSNGNLEFLKPYWVRELETGKYKVLFLDDFHLVQTGIQKFLYRLLTDRQLHNWKLPAVKVIIAGNFNIDSAAASLIQSPIMGRIECFLEYVPSIDSFMSWAYSQPSRFDSRILAFLKSNPELLFDKDPVPTTKYPSPRSWEHLSKNIAQFNSPQYAEAIVGVKAGNIFKEFWDLLSKDPEKILDEPVNKANPKDLLVAALILSSYYASRQRREEKIRILNYVLQTGSDIQFIFARSVVGQVGARFLTELRQIPECADLLRNLEQLVTVLKKSK